MLMAFWSTHKRLLAVLFGGLLLVGIGIFLFTNDSKSGSEADITAIRSFIGNENIALEFVETREPTNFRIIAASESEESGLIILRPDPEWKRTVNVYATPNALNGTCAKYEFEVFPSGNEVTYVRPLYSDGCVEEDLYSPQLDNIELWQIGFDFIDRAIGANFYRIAHEALNGGSQGLNADGSTRVFIWSWSDPDYQLSEGLEADENTDEAPAVRLRVSGAGKLLLYSNTAPFFQQPSLTDPDGPFDLPEGTSSGRRATLEHFSKYELLTDTSENRERAEKLGMNPRDYYWAVMAHAWPGADDWVDYDAGRAVIDGRKISLFSYPNDWVNFRSGIVEAYGLADPVPGRYAETIWKARAEGLYGKESYKFNDIDRDGVPEIEVTTDGGGNRPTCIVEYYRWEGSTFERITWGQDGESMDCPLGGHLSYEDGQAVYYSYALWYENPGEDRGACFKHEIVYTYDPAAGNFNRTSERQLEEINDGLMYFCR